MYDIKEKMKLIHQKQTKNIEYKEGELIEKLSASFKTTIVVEDGEDSQAIPLNITFNGRREMIEKLLTDLKVKRVGDGIGLKFFHNSQKLMDEFIKKEEVEPVTEPDEEDPFD